MPPVDVTAYLRRTGAPRPTAPTLAALAALHEAHVGAIPFENLDVLLGREIRLDLESLQAKLVAGARGGYCFEHNTLFAAVLEEVGFAVTRLGGRVGSRPDAVRPRTHMVLRVDLPQGPFLADVGFGGDGPVHPVPFDPPAAAPGTGHRVVAEPDGFALHGPDGSLYTFTLERQHAVDYELGNYWTSTHPTSHFRRTLTAQRSWPGGRAILRDRELVETRDGDRRVTAIADPDHLLAVLDGVFGLRFPPGTRFPVPEF
ncbi:MAG: arylamine N-acetyltransferase [Vicinamibacteria bacterium]